MRIRSKRRHKWNLAFASMSDIAFLLIVFFAVAGKFSRTTDRQVTLPAVDLGDATSPRDIQLVITKEGVHYVNDVRVPPEKLKEELEFYIMPDADRDAKTVRLNADRDAPYSAVAIAVDAVNQADGYLELAVNYKR